MPATREDRQERPRVPVGPHDVDLQLLMDESLEAVLARQEIAAQLEELQNPPDLRALILEHRDVIKLNITDQLERTRQLGNRLHELLAREVSRDVQALRYFFQLIEVANQLQDAIDAILEVRFPYSTSQTSDPGHVRAVLNAARERNLAADTLMAAEKGIRGALKAARKSDLPAPEWSEDPEHALLPEAQKAVERLDRIQYLIRGVLRSQRPAARKNLEFRALETEWGSARRDLGAEAESAIQGLALTALNKAMSTQFASDMHVGSLDGLQETITNEKVIITESFQRLESLIGWRNQGSFGISGPRGVGKTTLIKYFTNSTEPPSAVEPSDLPERPRLGVTVSAPVAYEPRDFILHLHTKVCRAVLGPDGEEDWDLEDTRGEISQRRFKGVSGLSVALIGAVSLVAGTLLLTTASALLTPPRHWWTDAGLILTGISAACLILLLATITQMVTPENAWITPELPRSERRSREFEAWTRSIFRAFLFCLTVAFCAAIGLPLVTASGGLGGGAWSLFGGLAAVAVGCMLLVVGWRMVRQLPHATLPEAATLSELGKLREVARGQLRRIRYEQTLSSERSMVLKLGGIRQLPVGADLGARQGTTVAERPRTYPEIVADLRSFIEAVTSTQELVIAIDELDKLKSAESVENFLNEIKAIFGLSRCLFLVSVSEEAAASFERRGVPFRDVFDSSFDDVLALKCLTMKEARKVLYSQLLGWTEPFVAFCYVLSAGLPRELHRSVREVVGRRGEDSKVQLTQVVPELMRQEAYGRLWAVRHSLQRESFDPAGLTLLHQLEGIQPAEAKAAQFRQWFEDFRLWVNREKSMTAQSDGPTRICTAARLGCELASFMIFAATVIEFFDDSLDAARLREAETTPGDKSLTHLVNARHSLSLNPWSSAASVARFRRAWGM